MFLKMASKMYISRRLGLLVGACFCNKIGHSATSTVRRHTRAPLHRKARPSPNLIVALECHPHSKGVADQSSA